MENELFAASLTRFVAEIQAMIDAHYMERFPNLTPEMITVDEGGRRYVRIVSSMPNGTCRKVFCFVERSTGRVLKSASWKAPAKHGRGNISEHASKSCTVYGAAYLR